STSGLPASASVCPVTRGECGWNNQSMCWRAAPNHTSAPMDQPEPAEPSHPAVAATRPRRRWLGSVIAIVCLALLGGLAWYLTHQTKSGAVAAQGGPGGPGGPGPGGPGGGGGGRGAPPSTVGVAVARKADIPVVIEALGTVTPAANVTVRPQVSGVIT